MDWADVCDNPVLKDLPFKIELNEWGQIVMSPASNRHGRFQARICVKLSSLARDGDVYSECSVQTAKGVKVADVAWGSAGFVAVHKDETPFLAAPEVCVEIVSPSNSAKELALKVQLYLDAGAREVWLCDDFGMMTFLDETGKLERSKLFPAFPSSV